MAISFDLNNVSLLLWKLPYLITRFVFINITAEMSTQRLLGEYISGINLKRQCHYGTYTANLCYNLPALADG